MPKVSWRDKRKQVCRYQTGLNGSARDLRHNSLKLLPGTRMAVLKCLKDSIDIKTSFEQQ